MDWSHYPGKVLPPNYHPINHFSLNLANNNSVSLGPLTKACVSAFVDLSIIKK